MRLTWPLIGRSQEMAVIESAVSDAGAAGIIVWGATGVGKSRVAREALAASAAGGSVIRWAVGSASARSLPLGAFAPWVSPPDPANSQLVQLVRDVIESLTAAAPRTSVVVAVDDAHLLDDLSAFVLHQIVARRAAKVLLTIRSGEPIPVAVQDVWRNGAFERLDLQPLSADETAALLSATLGGLVDPTAVQLLWKLTRGNALYLRNIVEQEVFDGRLARRHGYWQWTGEPVVPANLAELIESRMGTLPGAIGEVVDALAVGEPIELEMLSRIADPEAIEDADVRGLIALEKVDGGVEVRLAHPLYGELRRKRVAATRLRRLRGRVAAELAESADRDEVRTVVRRAVLSVDSDLTPDAELLLKAAEGAMFLADAPLADRLADAAIRAGGGFAAYNVRAFALAWQGRGAAADDLLAATPTEGLTDEDQVYLLGHRGFGKLWGLADPDGAKKMFDEAARIATARTGGWTDAYMTTYWASMAKPEKAMEFGRGLDLAKLPPIVSSAATWGLVVAHGDAGRIAEADRVADAGDAYAVRKGTAAHMRLLIVDRHVGALLQCGRLGDARAMAEQARRQTADVPGVAQLLSTAIWGRAAAGSGRLGEARSLLATVAELFTGDSNGFRYRYLIPLTTALAMSGLTEEASTALSAVDAEPHRSYGFVEYERELARAWVAACHGAVSEAINIAAAAAEKTRLNGQFAAEVVCLQTTTQFGDGSFADRLGELTKVVEGPRVGAAACFARALAAGSGDELASVSEEFEKMGDLVAALDAAALAAIAFRRKDLRGSALGCSTRADALAERCGGASTPALRQASTRLPFTSREQEIVALLSEGLSSRAVAERLTLSVRTVEGHIYRAMAKTGVSSREELASLLRK
ncbi:helix-turn-helix transcriptional regulator [Mycobacterium intermedium]|uniref:Helix-turn-helix transcriptional regulator n=1 Tax=Mycobacterium intermedium TaxID=28445 RepID=A0A1E3S6W4_MYCIE|nr:helix-turn-helix transcriptional regulator [Mycobacterium intermedium]ODQ97327.1 helix-turn-helix transcriptional regulator [Mycobacterium intermedium]ORA94334.1 helix-turn-helix transcriptional regulator [Mycobacterium intermedium]